MEIAASDSCQNNQQEFKHRISQRRARRDSQSHKHNTRGQLANKPAFHMNKQQNLSLWDAPIRDFEGFDVVDWEVILAGLYYAPLAYMNILRPTAQPPPSRALL